MFPLRHQLHVVFVGELGHVDAVDFLAQWDYGDETTNAAFENGDVHDTAPVYPGDRQAETGDYAMTYNLQAGHVALYRRHLIPAEDAIDRLAQRFGPPALGGQ